MKAIQVNQPGGPEVLQLADLPIPQPKPNEAVVKIAAGKLRKINVLVWILTVLFILRYVYLATA